MTSDEFMDKAMQEMQVEGHKLAATIMEVAEPYRDRIHIIVKALALVYGGLLTTFDGQVTMKEAMGELSSDEERIAVFVDDAKQTAADIRASLPKQFQQKVM